MKKHPAYTQTRALIGALEPRVLLDGAVSATVVAAATENQVAIIDSSYGDSNTINQLKSTLENQGMTVYTISSGSNGLTQVNNDLANYVSDNSHTSVDVLHIYSKADNDDSLHLGNIVLKSEHEGVLHVDKANKNALVGGNTNSGIGAKFSQTGQVLIHGVGTQYDGHIGYKLINNLANVFQVDVANALSISGSRVAIIDNQISGAQQLADSLANRFNYIYTIDGSSNGLTQLLDKITHDGLTNITDLHIYSLGDTGSLQLGSSIINNYNVSNYATDLGELGKLIGDDGSIYLYGSDIGAASIGQTFVNSVANLTDAHIVASANQTGRTDTETKGQITGTILADWAMEVVDQKSESIKSELQQGAVSAFHYSFYNNSGYYMLDMNPATISDPHIKAISFNEVPGKNGNGSSFGWHNIAPEGQPAVYENTAVEIEADVTGIDITGGILTINAFDVDRDNGGREYNAIYIKGVNTDGSEGTFQRLYSTNTSASGNRFLDGSNAAYSATVFDLSQNGINSTAVKALEGFSKVIVRVVGADISENPDRGYSFSAISGSLSIISDKAPTANANNYISINPGDTYVLKTGDFGFKDDDAGDTLQNIRIDKNFINSDPHVKLLLDDVEVTANQEISAGAITQGRLVIFRDNTNAASSFSFKYEVSDGYMYSSNSSLQPTLHINTPPTATAVAIDVTEDNSAQLVAGALTQSGELDWHDVDSSDTHTFSSSFNNVTAPADISLTDAEMTALKSGTFSIDSDGKWSYHIANTAVDFLAAGQTAKVSYDVTVIDQYGGTVTRTATVSIHGSNDVPVVISNFVNVDTNVNDGSLGLNVLPNVSGTFTLSGLAALGTVTLANGNNVQNGDQLSASDIAELRYHAANNGADNDSFTIIFNDGHGGTTQQAVTIHLNGAELSAVTLDNNEQATLIQATDANTSNLNASGSLGISDVDHGDTLASLTITSAYNADAVWKNSSGTTLTNDQISTLTQGFGIKSDKSGWQYTVANSAVQFLGAGETITLSFKVTATDSHGGSASRDVTITINGQNDAPVVASNNTINVDEKATGSSLGLTAPTDVDGDTLTITVTGLPTLGAVKLADGTMVTNGMTLTSAQLTGLVYDAPTNYNGTDTVGSFSYSVTDGKITTPVTGSVAFTVNAINDAPVINSTSSTLTGSVTEDSTLTATGTIVATDVDSSNLTFSGSATGNYGSIAINSQTGAWTYTLDNANQQALADGEQHTDRFTLTVNDGNGGSASKTVTITVNGSNDAPTLTVVNNGSVTEDGVLINDNLSASGSLTAADIDSGDSLTLGHSYNNDAVWTDADNITHRLTAAQISALSQGFSIDSDNTGWHYNVANSAVQFLGAGETVSLSFAVSVSDNHNGTVTKNVTITLNGADDEAQLTVVSDSGSVTEDTNVNSGNLTTSGKLTLTDADQLDTPTFSTNAIFDVSKSTNNTALGSLTINANGQWQYQVDNDAVQSLATGETVTEIYTVTGADNISHDITITINGQNDAPVVASNNTINVDEKATGSSLGLTAPTDVDGDTLTITVTGLPTLGAVKLADGTMVTNGMTLTSAQLTGLVYDAPTNYNGTDTVGSFSYSVTDGKITTPVTGSVAFTVNAINDAPVINSTSSTLTGSVTEDSALTATGTIVATDVDSSHLTFSGSTTGDYGSIAIDSQTGVWTYTLDNANQQALADGEQHTDRFTLTVNDGNGGSASKTVTITVNGSNDAPTLVLANSGAMTEDSSITDGKLSASGSLSAADIDSGDSLTLGHSYNNDAVWTDANNVTHSLTAAQISALSQGFSIDSDNTGWHYNVANSAVQFLGAGETVSLSFAVSVSDNHNGTVTKNVTITLNGADDEAQLTVVSDSGSVTEDTNVNSGNLTTSGKLTLTDADQLDTPTFSTNAIFDVSKSTNNTALGSLTINANGQWQYQVDNDAVQSLATGETVTEIYTVTGADNISHDITITINGQNDEPLVSANNGQNDVSSDNGNVSGSIDVTLIDSNNAISDISSRYNQDIRWSGGTLTDEQQTAFTPDALRFEGNQWHYDTDADLAFLGEGETIHLSYTVTVTDAHGAKIDVPVTITLVGSNDAPTISADAGQLIQSTADGSQAIIVSGGLAVNDLDSNDSLTITTRYNNDLRWADTNSTTQTLPLALTQQLQNGDFSVDSSNGVWQYDAGQIDLSFLGEGETIQLSYTVTVTDAHGAQAELPVSITLVGSNDAPNISADSGQLLEASDASQQAIVINGGFSVSDPDSSATLNVSAAYNNDVRWTNSAGTAQTLPPALAQQLANGTFSIDNNNGQWQYDAGQADLDFLAEGDSISLSYTLTVVDEHGGSSAQVVTIALNGSNDAPVVLTELPATNISVDDPINLNISNNFSDADNGANLSYSANGLPNGVSIDANTGIINGAPTTAGEYQIIISATDAEGAVNTITLELQVEALPISEIEPSVNTGPIVTPEVTETNIVNEEPPAPSTGSMDNGLIETPSAPTDAVGYMSVVDTSGDQARTLQGAVDVSVDADGYVQFTDEQEQIFGSVQLRIDQVMPQNDGYSVTISDTRASGATRYSAAMADGSQLPNWIEFDSGSGSFRVANPPANIDNVRVQLRATDDDGTVRILQINLDQLLQSGTDGLDNNATPTDANASNSGPTLEALPDQIPAPATDEAANATDVAASPEFVALQQQATQQFSAQQDYGRDLASLFNS
ncbi:VCBS domain-containing protein [Shewanella sp. A3A]|nr:VCBS domain-containing protein [Shewanella ferrihydritica]